MGGRLLYRDANGRDAAVDLSPDGSFLGRAADCAIRTDDAMVSRKNCRIWLQSGHWQVEDLGSSNGTFVNEARVQRQVLRHADVVRCGTLQVRFIEVDDGASGVQVDPSLTNSQIGDLKDKLDAAQRERDSLSTKLRELAAELEPLKKRVEQADGDRSEAQKMRAETALMKEQLIAANREKSQQEEELGAQIRVAEQLRKDLEASTQAHVADKGKADDLADELAARDRQLDRAHEDVQRTKLTLDEARLKLAEVEKTKDAGWKELNARVGELDNLRAVIAEQERLLEERRVGLIALEASAQELRQEKEKLLREVITARTERDESREAATRARHQIEGLEEEHRRLARLLSSGAGGAAGEDQAKLVTELRDAKVEVKTLRSESERLKQRVERTDAERVELEAKAAKLDVERAQAHEERQRAEGARARAEEGRARAEAARQRIDEERAAAVSARDSALTGSDMVRREHDRDRKRVAELEAQVAQLKQVGRQRPAAREGARDPARDPRATGAHEAAAEARIAQLEGELAKLGAELALVRAAAEEEAPTNGVALAAGGGAAASGDSVEIRRRAGAAYAGINDALSELRTNILVARALVAEHKQAVRDPEAARALEEAIAISVERTEACKGLLRNLREVVEG
jgi:pSer/pThr/pTyr-binding forkhead associated (FHA) protein